MADLREAVTPSLLAKPTVYLLAPRRDADSVHAMLQHHSVPLPAANVRLVGTGARGGSSGGPSKADVLTELRRAHPTAVLRYVDDDAASLRAAAADPRLFSVELHFALWGYNQPTDEASVAAMPRVHALTDSRQLEDALRMPRKDGMGFRSTRRRPPPTEPDRE